MKYLSLVHGDAVVEELTPERARLLLEWEYKPEAVADIFDNGKAFRLSTSNRYIWTQDDNGMIPMPGLYGICG